MEKPAMASRAACRWRHGTHTPVREVEPVLLEGDHTNESDACSLQNSSGGSYPFPTVNVEGRHAIHHEVFPPRPPLRLHQVYGGLLEGEKFPAH